MLLAACQGPPLPAAADATPEEVANLLQPVELPPPVPAAPASATTQPAADTAAATVASRTPAELADGFLVHLGSENISAALAALDLGSSGIFYQLLAGPLANETTADALCARLKRQGQYCNPIAPRG